MYFCTFKSSEPLLSNSMQFATWQSPNWTSAYHAPPVWKHARVCVSVCLHVCMCTTYSNRGMVNNKWVWQMSPQLDSWQRDRDREEDRVQIGGKGQWDLSRQIKSCLWMSECVSVQGWVCECVGLCGRVSDRLIGLDCFRVVWYMRWIGIYFTQEVFL